MDAFRERLIIGAATIDELLSAAFEPSPSRQAGPEAEPRRGGDADPVARRLAAWRRSCAAGDDALFKRRLGRDGWSLAAVTARLAAVRRTGPTPTWLDDATWIEATLQDRARPAAPADPAGADEAYPFEELFTPIVAQADRMLWSGLAPASTNLTADARSCLRRALLGQLSGLCMAALYERFAHSRAAGYAGFLATMRSGGFRRLFEDKPVLLRLMAVLTRQWIETSGEFVTRLAADLPILRRDLLPDASGRVDRVEGGLSDLHNGGRSVLLVRFEDGSRLVYKPKDLRLDVAWQALIAELNRSDPPLELKAVRTVAREGYGWAEYIAHAGCADAAGCARFFRRAGAWLALLHCAVATDMHQENMIAAGEHPVPIDLETVLQPSAEEHKAKDPDSQAFDAAMEIVGNSIMTVGLLPAYGRSVDNNVFAMGGMTADWNRRSVVKWTDINSDAMRPIKAIEHSTVTPNLPHVGGRYASFTDHTDSFIAGFEDYAGFLSRRCRESSPRQLFADFAGLPVRRVVRPTRFYYMLIQRLKDHRTMDDGAVWSAQADFIARLADWDRDDPLWPLQRAERSALLTLNVPHFVSPSDGTTIADANGNKVDTAAVAGLARAAARLQNLDAKEIAWQAEVIREHVQRMTAPDVATGAAEASEANAAGAPDKALFFDEAGRIAGELADYAIRRGPGAAWIGLDWLGDAEVFQLVCLGPDLYNGTAGIGLFLAAHAATTGSDSSAALAQAGLAHWRNSLRSSTAARMARALGIGGGVGLGSILYALTVMAQLLADDRLRADAEAAARLFTDDLIAADKRLDVMGGSAGAILALLRLHRDSGSGEVLDRAIRCGEHLLRQPRLGEPGRRSWIGQGFGTRALNGMSHGAAGFAYALAALAAAARRDDFAAAAAECLAYENAGYDAVRHNWPDWRGDATAWPCQWCHGGPGIGLARIAMQRRGNPGAIDAKLLASDISHAVAGVESGAPMPVDTLCCGALGAIEFFCEAATVLGRDDLRAQAVRRLQAVLDRARASGDYRWNSGQRRFNLGLFRGLAGVGYTLLRQANARLPNVVIWE